MNITKTRWRNLKKKKEYELPHTNLHTLMKTIELNELTEILRECDDKFQDVGGSTRHYVRDLLLPTLEERGFVIIKIGELKNIDVDVSEIRKELTLKLREKGYSIRQIQRALEYKSPRSVHKIIHS